MKNNPIKAPKELKLRTLVLMNKQKSTALNYCFKTAIALGVMLVSTAVTAFAYSAFSAIDGDEINFHTIYKGGGMVEIEVTNLANKDLKFSDSIILIRESSEEEVLTINQTLPVIASEETKIIEIEIPANSLNDLEEPLPEGDWYQFLLTTNNFAFGQTWQTSFLFSESAIAESEQITYPEIPLEDNTDIDSADFIENHFIIQQPLSKMQVTFYYSDYKADGTYLHPELDLFAKVGDNIYPFSDGIVLEAESDEIYGNYMIIDHGSGVNSRYNYCDELFFTVGDTVTLDDVIATVGQTGMVTGPHLGFSVSVDGVPLNPESFFKE